VCCSLKLLSVLLLSLASAIVTDESGGMQFCSSITPKASCKARSADDFSDSLPEPDVRGEVNSEGMCLVEYSLITHTSALCTTKKSNAKGQVHCECWRSLLKCISSVSKITSADAVHMATD
jgi:hypothetical protein